MKKYKILHIPTGEYCLIAPYNDEYLLDVVNTKNQWCFIQRNISYFKWHFLFKHNKLNHIFIYNISRLGSDGDPITSVSINEFTLVEA